MRTIPPSALPQTCIIQPFLYSGSFGDEYGPVVERRCRVDLTRKLVRAQSGDEVVSEATIIIASGVDVPISSNVQLPGSDVYRTVITSNAVVGAKVVHHIELTT